MRGLCPEALARLAVQRLVLPFQLPDPSQWAAQLPPHFDEFFDHRAHRSQEVLRRIDSGTDVENISHPILAPAFKIIQNREGYFFPYFIAIMKAAALLTWFHCSDQKQLAWSYGRRTGPIIAPGALRDILATLALEHGLGWIRISEVSPHRRASPEDVLLHTMFSGTIFDDDVVEFTYSEHGRFTHAIQLLCDACKIDDEYGAGSFRNFLGAVVVTGHTWWRRFYEQSSGLTLANPAYVNKIIRYFSEIRDFVTEADLWAG